MKKLDELKRSNLENLLFISKKLSKFKIFLFLWNTFRLNQGK